MEKLTEILKDKISILVWIEKNLEDGKLSEKKQNEMPDLLGGFANTIQNDEMKFAPGMLDSIVGGWDRDEGKAISQELFEIFKNLNEVVRLDDNEENQILLDLKMGKAYEFLLSHTISEFSGEFAFMLGDCKDDELVNFILRFGIYMMKNAVHKEPVKFGIVTSWFYRDDEIMELLKKFGLVYDFSKYVGYSLEMKKDNQSIFELAKITDGWARINYITCLTPPLSDEIRQWLFYDGYKNNIGANHIAFECAKFGDLLEFMQNSWNEKLYENVGEIICGVLDDWHSRASEYDDLKAVLSEFINRSLSEDINLAKFRNLCEIGLFLQDKFEEINLSESQKNEFVNQILSISEKYDWKKIILENPFDYDARFIANSLDIDIWDKFYQKALNDENFNDWYFLANTSDIERFKKVCELATKRFDLKKIASGLGDELGLKNEFNADLNLSMILQQMPNFSEIIGLDLVKAALNSPVVSTRNFALRVVNSWEEIPSEILQIVKENILADPSDSTKEGYKNILNSYYEKILNRHKG